MVTRAGVQPATFALGVFSETEFQLFSPVKSLVEPVKTIRC